MISYEETAEELWIGSAFFDEVTEVSIEEPGDLFSDTLVLLALADGDGFYLLLSAAEGGDARFLNELEKRME